MSIVRWNVRPVIFGVELSGCCSAVRRWGGGKRHLQGRLLLGWLLGYFLFPPPFLREGGGGVRGEGGIPLKSQEKGGQKGGERRGRCTKRVRAFFGGRGP